MTQLNPKPPAAPAFGKVEAEGYRHITVGKVTPIIGAEIAGVDLSQPLSHDVLEEIRRAFLENLVIFFHH